MVVIQLKGGLGNQLFQYAAARALALKHHTDVVLDTSHYSAGQIRDFELLHLNVQARMITHDEMLQHRPASSLRRAVTRLLPVPVRSSYKQPFFHFDARFFRLPATVYLQGYFQSERYFEPYKETIRKEFSFREELPRTIIELGKRMRLEPSVSVHIRRGDYKNPETLRVHGMLPLSYYYNAAGLLQKKLLAPAFYIFTDDPAWVRENVSIPGAVLVSGPLSKTHFEDLYLMQQCRHNIIANSSFSWWGAWLNDNPHKQVIAPLRWFNEDPSNTKDLIPSGWVRI